MNKNFEFLKTNFPEYFKNKTISDGFVSKIFTFVDDKHQYIFINHWENVITRALETDFYEFLVKKYNANCYSRGSLSINENEEQFISLIFVEKNNNIGIEMDSLITRDKNNKITKIGKFKTYSCDRENLLFGWLYNETNFSKAQLNVLNTLYDDMKEHFIIVNLDN